MNPKTPEVRNIATKTAKRTALVLFAASVFSLPLHGQNAAGSESAADQVVAASSASESIPPAVMKELEEMKKRIAQLEAQLQKRDGQPARRAAAEGTETAFQGPNAP